MKKLLAAFFALSFTIPAFCDIEITVDYPSLIELEPSCSDWFYDECSIEVSGANYYKFELTEISGDLVVPYKNLDFDDDCGTTWYIANPPGDAYFPSYGTSGNIGLKLRVNKLDQIPGREKKIRLTVWYSAWPTIAYEVTTRDIIVKVKEPSISNVGPVICHSNTKTFTFTDLPSSVNSLNFDISSNLYEVSSTSNSITVRAQTSSTSGVGWIKPEYNMSCGHTIDLPTMDFYVGKFQSIVVDGTAAVCHNSLYVYEAEVPLGHKAGYSYSWTYPSGWYYYSQWNNYIHLQTPILPENMTYGTVRVAITNECGTGNYSGITVYPSYSCGGYYMAAPNPSGYYTEIDISSDDAKSLETSYDSDIILTVVDKMGMPVMKVNVEGLPYNLDTSKLPNGEYIIQIISQPKGREAMIDSIKLIVSK